MNVLSEEGVVTRDTLSFREIRRRGELYRINLRGRVHTAHGAVLVVNKWLDVRHRRQVEVRTFEYAYHAFVRRPSPRRDLFRYDNCHGGLDTLHCHRYVEPGGLVNLEPIAHDQLPWLSEIIREAESAAATILSV